MEWHVWTVCFVTFIWGRLHVAITSLLQPSKRVVITYILVYVEVQY